MRLSKELEDELRLQPHHVREEFRALCDRLERLGAPSSEGQVDLPGLIIEYDVPRTWPLGSNGCIVFQIVGECDPEVLDARWPSEVDQDTPEGRPPRGR